MLQKVQADLVYQNPQLDGNALEDEATTRPNIIGANCQDFQPKILIVFSVPPKFLVQFRHCPPLVATVRIWREPAGILLPCARSLASIKPT
jgi:hypothetical protein